MSNAALLHEVQEVPKTQEALAIPQPALVSGGQRAAAVEFDPHPLLTVLVAMSIAAAGAAALVGSIVVCLALRHSGVMAP